MKVTIQLTLDDSMADDLRVFYAKAMQGNQEAACQHPRSMSLLASLPKHIENAAGYERAMPQEFGLPTPRHTPPMPAVKQPRARNHGDIDGDLEGAI